MFCYRNLKYRIYCIFLLPFPQNMWYTNTYVRILENICIDRFKE